MWLDVNRVAPGVCGITEGGMVHAYLVEGADRATLVDTGLGIGDIGALVRGLTAAPAWVVNTHGHLDHVGGNSHFETTFLHQNESLKEAGAIARRFREMATQDDFSEPFPEGFSMKDYAPVVPEPTHRLAGGEILDLGGRTLEVLPTPGHTIGSICLLDEASRFLFAGDMASDRPLQGIGENVDIEVYKGSVRLMAQLAPDVDLIFPGHGASPLQPAFLEELAQAAEHIDAAAMQETEVGGRRASAMTVGRFTFFRRHAEEVAP
jgi:hydroxyacylglutathione hydrolase